MKCRDCKFLSPPQALRKGDYPSVRCTLGLWDNDNKEGAQQWYSYGESQLNRGPIRRHGDTCARGEPK